IRSGVASQAKPRADAFDDVADLVRNPAPTVALQVAPLAAHELRHALRGLMHDDHELGAGQASHQRRNALADRIAQVTRDDEDTAHGFDPRAVGPAPPLRAPSSTWLICSLMSATKRLAAMPSSV